jgi:hypothetical protein
MRQECSSVSGLTGEVDGDLPPAQNTALWVVFAIMPYKPRATPNQRIRSGRDPASSHIS